MLIMLGQISTTIDLSEARRQEEGSGAEGPGAPADEVLRGGMLCRDTS